MRLCGICNSANALLIENFKLDLISDINLNNSLNLYYCDVCYYYYSDSNNNQNDYNQYYLNFNNYKQYVISNDKDEKCFQFLNQHLQSVDNTYKIIDYGCGNNELANKLKNKYNVDTYDIGMELPCEKYNCIVVSHVLEHIYDINKFINNLESILNIEDGMIYIEVPNAEYYHSLNDLCPLQEINIEHVNFFSKYALNKLMMNHNYYCKTLIDDYFNIKDNKYYVIRGLFVKKHNNLSFQTYLNDGNKQLISFDYDNINKHNNLYLYGCGQFLFKILKFINNNNIINIVDDNPCFENKKINNIEIINYDIFKNKVNPNDNVVITTLISYEKIEDKIKLIDQTINILKLDI
jgi:hypothetical protein